MKTGNQKKKFFVLLLLLVGPGLVLIWLSKGNHVFKKLPYYGQKEVVFNSGQAEPDTIYHKVPDFSFTNQNGEKVSFDDFEGKIIVADFFFTRCPTICPIMTKQLTRLQWQMDDPAFDQVQILSHTVDPEHDTPEVLKEYAERNGAELNSWTFVTGEKEEIYEQGMKGYLLSTQEDEAAPGGFLHSGNFVLLDKDRHIRGFYDGTSTKEVDDLMDDILMLLKEEEVG